MSYLADEGHDAVLPYVINSYNRTDLQGIDVMRKAIILARETGAEVEAEDIDIKGFLPEECLKGTVDDFFATMEKNEAYFAGLRNDALAKGGKLRYMA